MPPYNHHAFVLFILTVLNASRCCPTWVKQKSVAKIANGTPRKCIETY